MNASIPICFASVQDVLHHEFITRVVDREPYTPITDTKAVLAGFALHGRHVAMSGFGITPDGCQDLLQFTCGNAAGLALDPMAKLDRVCHSSDAARSATRHSNSSSDIIGLPARRSVRVSSMARNSSSVSGSSSGGAFRSDKVTGSSFSARGMQGVCAWPHAQSRQSVQGRSEAPRQYPYVDFYESAENMPNSIRNGVVAGSWVGFRRGPNRETPGWS